MNVHLKNVFLHEQQNDMPTQNKELNSKFHLLWEHTETSVLSLNENKLGVSGEHILLHKSVLGEKVNICFARQWHIL